MDEKKRKKVSPEIERQNTPEIESQTDHPGLDEDSIRNVTFAPGENNYLSQSGDIE